MANQYKQARRQGRQQAGGPSHKELSDQYGDPIFNPLEAMVKDVVKRGVVVDDGNIVHIKEVAGEQFAGELQTLRQTIFEVPQDHKGPVDGWMKQTINDSFTEEEADIAFFLVMPGQARKHQFIIAVAAFVAQNTGREIKVVSETKTFVNGLLGEAADLVQKLSADTDAASPEPKREDFTTFGEHLRAKVAWRDKQTKMKEGLGEIKGQISWLRNWVEGKPRPGKPGAEAPAKSKTAIEVKQAEVEALKTRIFELKSDESKFAALQDYGNAGQTQTEWKQLTNTDFPRIEAELTALVQAEELKTRVEAAAQIVAGSPEAATGKFPVAPEGAAAVVVHVLADKSTGGPTIGEQIEKLEIEIARQLAAAEANEAEATRLSKEGRAEEDDLKAAQMINEARLVRGKAGSARAFAAKAGIELVELKAEAPAVEAPKPAVVTPSAAPSAATVTTTTTTAADDQIVFLEECLEESDDVEVTKAVAGLLSAVRLAKAANKGAKRIAKAIARLHRVEGEINVEAIVADTEALLELAK